MSDINPTESRRHNKKRRRVAEIKMPDGDVLVPRASFAEDEIGTSDRTARRLNLPTTFVNGIAYVARNASLKIIAAGVKRPNTITPKRHRRA